MSFEATLGLSLLELLHVLNKKFTLECARVREIRLPPGVGSVTTLEAEVGAALPILSRYDLTIKISDRISQSQGGRGTETYSLVEKPAAADQQVAARDPLSNRQTHPRPKCKEHEVDHSNDARVQILAQLHNIYSRELDPDIERTVWPGRVEP